MRYERGRELGCVTDVEIGDELSMELALKGSGVSGMEEDSGCLNGGVFRDDLTSGRRTDFERI